MFVLIAAKSVVIAGGTLLALQFMRGRSASDRSWIAHLGLAALAALPLGSVLFPPVEVTAAGLPAPAWVYLHGRQSSLSSSAIRARRQHVKPK